MTNRSVARSAAAFCLVCALSGLDAGSGVAQVNVTTYHYDSLRTGWNPNETALTQGNLVSSHFGLLKTIALDDQVDSQPLLVNDLQIAGGTHNVLYVATESDSVYAIDAQSGQVLLHASLGTAVSSANIPAGCHNNGPNIGIVSTPVIDLSASLMYVIAYTWESGAAVYRIHALSLTTLADAATPTAVSAQATLDNGAAYQFNPAVQRQRPGLLLANGNVYAGFGSFCDLDANLTRGWVLGWKGGSLQPLAANKLVNALSKSPHDFFLSSVWMSGYGLASNSSGSVFFTTGNSDKTDSYDSVKNIAESAAKMSSDLSSVQDLFTPSNHALLDRGDKDFGSGGFMLLPTQSGSYPDLAVAAGKFGTLYLLDADNLSNVLDSEVIGQCWCGPSYFTGSDGAGRVVASGGKSIGIWELEGSSNPKLVLQSSYGPIPDGQYPGYFTTVSSNGTAAGSAIVWTVSRPVNRNPAYVDLYAINADTGAKLFKGRAGQWLNFGGDSNIVPVVANGYVYVAADQTVAIFGAGAKGGVAFPDIRGADMRVPLAPGEHEIYGTIESVRGDTIIVKKRDGAALRVDAAKAERGHLMATPAAGDALIARGRYARPDMLDADTVLHAVNNPSTWPPDR